jgi:hypothetical protein
MEYKPQILYSLLGIIRDFLLLLLIIAYDLLLLNYISPHPVQCKSDTAVEEEIIWKFKNKLPVLTKLVTRSLCSEQMKRIFFGSSNTREENR